jgi:hypothetical protein
MNILQHVNDSQHIKVNHNDSQKLRSGQMVTMKDVDISYDPRHECEGDDKYYYSKHNIPNMNLKILINDIKR